MADHDMPDNYPSFPALPDAFFDDADDDQPDLLNVPSYLRAFVKASSPANIAVGIIMGTQNCSESQARALLHSASHQRNAPINVVAADIIASIDAPWPGPEAPPTP
jgi:hypothetical protein